MLGEDAGPRADVTATGLAGDRCYALIHQSTGRVVSAKNPRLWRAMLTLSAALAGDAVKITFPDGKTIWSSDADVDDVLSGFLEQPVTLTATPPPGAQMEHADPDDVIRHGVAAVVKTELVPLGVGTFFNFAPVHLLTTATLARIAELSPNGNGTADTLRYRPNIVLSMPGHEGFTENHWLDRDLKIGEVLLRVIARTPRCVVPTLAHGAHLPRDPAALRVAAEHNRVPATATRNPEPCIGVYAQVLRPGRLLVGDTVTDP
jgi:uncharacterized protein